jgi:hypothetical protein
MDVLEKEDRWRGEIDAGKTPAEDACFQKWERARQAALSGRGARTR